MATAELALTDSPSEPDFLTSPECSLEHLPPPALAAIVAHLPAIDLLRLSLASNAVSRALHEVPCLFSDTCTFALGWPRLRPRQQQQETLGTSPGCQQPQRDMGGPSSSAAASSSPSTAPFDAQATAKGSAGAEGGASSSAVVLSTSADAKPALSGGGIQTAAEAACAQVAPTSSSADDAFCRGLLSAAAVLATSAGPHSLRPSVHGPPQNVSALMGRCRGLTRQDPLLMCPPLVLTQHQQYLLSLGGPGVCVRARATGGGPRWLRWHEV